MSNIQIKNVPKDLHSQVRERASGEGMSMRDYVLRALERELKLDTLDAWFDEAERLEPLEETVAGDQIADLIHEGREERAAQVLGALDDA